MDSNCNGRMAQGLSPMMAGQDFFRKSDGIVTLERHPLACNAAEVAASVPKSQFLSDFARLLLAEPEWSL